jgi:acyl carrier protein
VTEATIAAQLRGFYNEVFPHPGRQLHDDTDLLNEWFVDSFGVIQTVQFLEDNFAVTVTRGEINANNFHSIRALAGFVLSKLSPRS